MELFEARVARSGEALAVACGGQQLSYAELNARANQLAHYLHGLGVGAETLVGVCLERSVDMVVALLGILKAGGAYVPLDPNYPSERLAFMLDDSAARVVITATTDDRRPTTDDRRPTTSDGRGLVHQLRAVVGRVPSGWWSVVDLVADWPAIAQAPAGNPAGVASPDQLAYVTYTSGSTGTPKGVLGTQRGILNRLDWMWQTYPFAEGEVCCHKTSLNFVDSVWELFGPLLHGLPLILLPDAIVQDPPQLVAALAAASVTRIVLVPSLLQALLASELDLAEQLPRLRYWTSSGEALSGELARRFRERLPQAVLLNLYGSSEVAADALWHELDEECLRPTVPLGRPIANLQVYVLDRTLRQVPVGVVGELYVGGAGLARGYVNRPDLTAERFVPNPFTDFGFAIHPAGVPDFGLERAIQNPKSGALGRIQNNGGRLYKTGDLGRYLPDGTVDFLGRIDHQVKLRGYRIELGEIEAVLARHPAVDKVLVVAREDRPGDKRLVAYLVPTTDDRRPTTEDQSSSSIVHRPSSLVGELRAYLKQHLPEYMLPSTFVLLDALPLTPNGKVDRRALPAPEQTQAAPAATFLPPRTPLEELLVGIMAEVLHLPQIGVADSFFDLGGHSLLATQVLARVRNALQVQLPVRSLFEAPTVAELARVIERAQQAPGQLAPALGPLRRDGPPPLSFAQQRLWFLDQLAPGTAGYSIPLAVRLAGRLDLAALRQSADTLVGRHETLRTVFPMVDGQPIQLVQPAAALLLTIIDLRGYPEAERMRVAEQHLRASVQQPFDLAAGPLVRLTLLQLAEDEHVALLCLHHIIADGWSIGVLLRELTELYAAFAEGQAPTLADLPIQYADFATWQRQWLQGEVLEAQLEYWRSQLAGAPAALELPTDHPRPAVQSFRGATHKLVLPPSLSAGLSALSRQEGATLFMTLLAAFDVLLYRYTGQTDIVVGTPIAGRTHAELEGLIGCFVNTLVLRSELSDNLTYRGLLARVRGVTLDAYSHQDLPFELLVEALQPSRDLSRNPLFQVMLILQKPPAGALTVPDLRIEPLDFASGAAQLDLMLSFIEQPAGLVGTLEYNTDLFDAATIARLLQHFQLLLEGIVADPDQLISRLPLLTAGEHEQLLGIGTARPTSYPREAGIHTLIEAQAARTPNAVALVRGEQQLTYAELNARANQLAHYLRERGVGPGGLVGICLERSVELVVALLGVLKAGGAYVPLDLTYPRERLAFMLEDSQAQVLITQGKIGDWRLEIDAASQSPISDLQSPITVDVIADRDAIAREPADNLERNVMPEQLAYVIYTSGSTGQPKGVQIPHRAVVNFLTSMAQTPGLGAADVLLAVTTIAFDIAGLELFLPLTVGARVVLVGREVAIDGAQLRARLETSGATVLQATPATWRLLLEAGWDGTPRLRMLCGGEALPRALADQLLAQGGELWNMYGPTETTIWSTVGQVAGGTERVAIGSPIANTQVYVLDAQLQPVPVGVVGELYIGGDGLAWGYRNRPDLTAERFVPNPLADFGFSIHPYGVPDFGLGDQTIQNPKSKIQNNGGRLYKTGDLARYRADGTLECLGRVDYQVKVRGFRIELGEIEAVLRRHPAVQDTVAVVREDAPADTRLVAYVVPSQEQRAKNKEQRNTQRVSDQEPGIENQVHGVGPQFSILNSQFSIQELRAHLKDRLPEYMVPSTFVVLDALPLTPNGKVDRRALPAPDRAQVPRAETFVAPRSSVEDVLADIWANMLGLERIGVHDNFFELGGHSLKAAQLIVRMREAFQVNLAVRSLFEAATVAAMAELLIAHESRPGQMEKIAQVLKRIRSMPAEDRQKVLDQKRRARGPA